MLFLIFLVLGQVFLPGFSQIRDHSDDFYWRDYNGIVPKDALPGGLDSDHKPTYIGQAVPSNPSSYSRSAFMLPGQIFSDVKKLYYVGEYNHAEVEFKNIKILCTKNPDNFEWIQGRLNSAYILKVPTLIPGGFVSGDEVYIGRAIANNILAVGKVLINQVKATVEFKTNVNGITYTPIEFEVLSYHMRNPVSSSGGVKILRETVLITVLVTVLCFVN